MEQPEPHLDSTSGQTEVAETASAAFAEQNHPLEVVEPVAEDVSVPHSETLEDELIETEQNDGPLVQDSSIDKDGETGDGYASAKEQPIVADVSQQDEVMHYSSDEFEVGELSSDSDEPDANSESDSSSSSDDSSSDDDEEDADEDIEEDGDSAEEMDDAADDVGDGPILSKNEIVDEAAPTLPEDLKIDETTPLEYVGNISGVVEQNVIIKANGSGEFRVLKENSILCLEDRSPLGMVFEVFGRLQSPLYRVKFNSEADALKYKEKKGFKVFYVIPHSEFILTESIKGIKGTDASNCHDEELAEEEQEFSDDEKEQASKQQKKKKNKNKKPKTKPTGDKPASQNQLDPYRSQYVSLPAPGTSMGQSNNPVSRQPAINNQQVHQQMLMFQRLPQNQQPQPPTYNQGYPVYNNSPQVYPNMQNANQAQQASIMSQISQLTPQQLNVLTQLSTQFSPQQGAQMQQPAPGYQGFNPQMNVQQYGQNPYIPQQHQFAQPPYQGVQPSASPQFPNPNQTQYNSGYPQQPPYPPYNGNNRGPGPTQ